MEINFKTYTGTKTIKATPMGASDAKHYGAAITDKTIHNNIGIHGYLVEYPDGYRSWSPAKAFEETYRVSETHVDRMKIELEELNERICKATRAINTFGAIPDDERWQLKEQADVMQKYAAILYQRIRYAIEPPIKIASSEPNGCSAESKKGDK